MRITDHGYDRLKELTGLKKKTAIRMTEAALREGSEALSATGDFGRYLERKRIMGRKVRIYKRNVFVFSSDDALITMFGLPKIYWKAAEKCGAIGPGKESTDEPEATVCPDCRDALRMRDAREAEPPPEAE